MDKNLAIKVENVSKKYCKSLKRSIVYGIHDILRNSVGLGSKSEVLRKDEFWALNNISFEVKKGEALGIIGPNGSGKTTLLKLLNGIFWPDIGKISIKGRVGALIAVGAGFHPLLTGRENIYVNAAILGMTKHEVDKKFDEIVAFANIGNFLDTPIKFYSSGMFVRLGFSIAAHSEPDILLFDEILAVGDELFQRKCIDFLSKLRSRNKTLIFVSHMLTAVQSLCTNVVYLSHGKNKKIGIPEDAISAYLNDTTHTSGSVYESRIYRQGTQEAQICSVELLNVNGMAVTTINSGEVASFKITARFNRSINNPIFGIAIKTAAGSDVYATNTRWQQINLGTFSEGDTVSITFDQKMPLCAGTYYLEAAIAYADGLTFCDLCGNILSFAVVYAIQTAGVVNLASKINVEVIQK